VGRPRLGAWECGAPPWLDVDLRTQRLAVVFAGSRLIATLLYGISPRDPARPRG